MLRVGASQIHGRGLFAKKVLLPGTTLEQGHLLEVPFPEDDHLCALADSYSFELGDEGRCLALGVASLCNHSENPNAEMVIDPKTRTYSLYAVCRINPGEEILIDYGHAYWEQQP